MQQHLNQKLADNGQRIKLPQSHISNPISTVCMQEIGLFSWATPLCAQRKQLFPHTASFHAISILTEALYKTLFNPVFLTLSLIKHSYSIRCILLNRKKCGYAKRLFSPTRRSLCVVDWTLLFSISFFQQCSRILCKSELAHLLKSVSRQSCLHLGQIADIGQTVFLFHLHPRQDSSLLRKANEQSGERKKHVIKLSQPQGAQ